MLIRFYAIGLSIILAVVIASFTARKTDAVKRGLILILLLHLVCLAMWLGDRAVAALMLVVAVAGAVELSRCSRMGTKGTALMVGGAAALFLAAKTFTVVFYALIPPCLAVLVFLFLPRSGRVRPRMEAWFFLLGLVVPCAAALSEVFARGPGHLTAMILFVQFNDTAAYFAGKAFGRRRLRWVSSFSPNKTLEGYAGGALGILAAAVLLHTAIPVYPVMGMAARTVLFFTVVFIFANLGDLAFSSVKRRLGVKDFSGLLSAHGGVLDRFDSIFCLSPVYLLLLTRGLI